MESAFPKNLPRPFSDRPPELAKSRAWYQSWLLAYTQPFLLILLAIWLALAIFMSLDNVSASTSKAENNTSETSEQLSPENPPRLLIEITIKPEEHDVV